MANHHLDRYFDGAAAVVVVVVVDIVALALDIVGIVAVVALAVDIVVLAAVPVPAELYEYIQCSHQAIQCLGSTRYSPETLLFFQSVQISQQ